MTSFEKLWPKAGAHFVALLLVVGMTTSASAETDLEELSQLLTGALDSGVQNEQQVAAGVPEDERHVQVTLFHRRVELPAFGPYVFYNQEFRDGDPGKVIRQRLITLERDGEAGAIRMKQYLFHDPEPFLGAHLSPALLAGISQDDVWLLSGCDVFWTQNGSVFSAKMGDMTCVFSFREGDRERAVIYSLKLEGDRFERSDRSVYVDTGEVAGGRSDDEPTVHLRQAAPW